MRVEAGKKKGIHSFSCISSFRHFSEMSAVRIFIRCCIFKLRKYQTILFSSQNESRVMEPTDVWVGKQV